MVLIRAATEADAGALADLYNHYVLHTPVTFETEPVSAVEMAGRVADIGASHVWLVGEEAGAVQGYAYAGPWKGRRAYRHSVETTVYLHPAQTGRGLGSALYRDLIEALRPKGLHALIGGIALPNAASVALHEKLGFEKVAHFREVGRKFERWIDVGYWELLLNPDIPDDGGVAGGSTRVTAGTGKT